MPKSALPKLKETQRRMLEAIRTPMTIEEGMQPESSKVANLLIQPNDRMSAFERLEIYNQQYWWRLVGIFEDDFPGVRAVVGRRLFDRLTTEYLNACPSRSWTLRNLGDRLPEFLEKHPDLLAPYTPLALDVARVEWANTAAFDDPAEEPVNPQQLASADPSNLHLGVQPYVHLLELRHPVDKLLARLRQRTASANATSNAVTAARKTRMVRITSKPLREPIFLAVHRVENGIYHKRLDSVSWRLLHALRENQTLEEACETAMAQFEGSSDEAAALVREAFGTFTTLGWLVRGKRKKG